MKRFILPLLLLLMVGSIFAVESDPSAVVGYVKYDCVTGLNFVALPMVDGHNYVSEVAANFNVEDDNLDTVFLWDSFYQVWGSAVNYGDGFWDPDLDVETGLPMYISALAPFSFYSIGSLPETDITYNIVEGLNTIMIPLHRSDLALTSDVGASVGEGDYLDTIFLWNNEYQVWDSAVNYGDGFWDPELSVEIGMPLYVISNGDFVWPSRSSALEPLRASKK